MTMTDEVAACFLPTDELAGTLSRLVAGLEGMALLEGGFSLEPDQVDELTEAGLTAPGSALVQAFGSRPLDAAALGAAVRALAEARSTGPAQPLFVYFRLLPPGKMPHDWRADFEGHFGEAETELSPHWVVHPYECWLVLDLNDAAGSRARRALSGQKARELDSLPPGALLLGRNGDAVSPAERGALEVRTTAANAQYLGFVMARLLKAPLYVSIE